MHSHHNKFSALNNFFDKIYILTIARGCSRQQKLNNDLLGLNFSFFEGIDKKDLLIETLIIQGVYSEDTAIQNHRYNKPMRLGEIACSMGHKAIYEDAAKNNYEKILVLEDDVEINVEGLKLFEEMIAQLPSNWDVVYFDYFKNETTSFATKIKQLTYHLQRKLGVIKFTHTTINNLFAKPFTQNLKQAGYHDYASAYALSKNAIENLIKLQTPIVFPADHVLPYAITNKILNGFITVPKVFVQQSQLQKHTVGSFVEN